MVEGEAPMGYMPTHAYEEDDTSSEDEDIAAFSGLATEISKFKQDPILREALLSGNDLGSHATKVRGDLAEATLTTLKAYKDSSGTFKSLGDEIEKADEALEGLEKYLEGVQDTLVKMGSGISSLRTESSRLKVQLENRRAVSKAVSEAVANLAIPPEFAKAVSGVKVGVQYHEISSRLTTFMRNVAGSDARAAGDVRPLLQKLVIVASSRISSFLVESLNGLRKPHTNTLILQETVFLKHRILFAFLKTHSPEQAVKIRSQYVSTMSEIYKQNFTLYIRRVLPLMRNLASKSDLLGSEGAGLRGLFGGSAKKQHGSSFVVGARAVVLENSASAPALVPHVAEAMKQKHLPEEVFRSINKLFTDASTSEFLFCESFFGSARPVFGAVMGPAQALVVSTLQQWVSGSHDALGVLLVVRVLQAHRLTMERRRIPALDPYFDSTTMALWPRFKSLLDHHIESLVVATRSAVKKTSTDTRPHYITRRVADFVSSIVQLNSNEEEMILMDLRRLRKAYSALVDGAASTHQSSMAQSIYSINNYDLITQVLETHGVAGTLEGLAYAELCGARLQQYVSVALLPRFGAVLKCADDLEPLMGSPEGREEAKLMYPAERFQRIVEEVAATWETHVDTLATETSANFPNLVKAQDVLKGVYSALIRFYQSFLESAAALHRGAPFLSRVVGVHQFYHRIKQNKLADVL